MNNEAEAMNMSEAIEMLKTTRATFYRWLRDGKIKGMKIGRQWRFYREDLERFLEGEAPRVDLPADIDPLLRQLEKKVEALEGSTADLREEKDPATRAVRLMLRLAEASRANALHVQPGQEEGLLRLRIDGQLHEVLRLDRRLVSPLMERWKSMASLDLNEKNRPQDGRLLETFPATSGEGEGPKLDVRVCVVPAMFGESLTARLLNPAQASVRLDQIDLDTEQRAALDRALAAKRGLVVVTGPAGCGKTTMLYACLNELRKPENMLMTVEDPVAYTLPDVVQIRVRPQYGVTFAPALRAMLRSDPDVILVGEIRDRESMDVTLQGAINGHLMMTALHTEDAVSGLLRLSGISEHPMVLADTVSVIMAQRLVRRVCPHCAEPAEPEEGLLKVARRLAETSGIDWNKLKPGFVRGKGCAHCADVGFRGRTVITEVLEMTPEMQTAQRAGAGEEEIRRIAAAEGMSSMAADGLRKAAAGKTTLAEVARVLGTAWWKGEE